MTTTKRGPRVVLALGIVAGVLAGVSLVRSQPEQLGIATDVYYGATSAMFDGADPYAYRPPDHPGFGFLYPPIVLLAFLPHVLTGSPLGAYLLQTGINLLAAGGLAIVLGRAIERGGVPLDRVDWVLVGGYAVASSGVAISFVNGQVNLELALAIAAGATLLETGRTRLAGVLFALAAIVKLFPATVGAWLLRTREWTAVAAATITGLGLLLAGLLAFGPDLTVTYVTEVLPNEASVGSFADGPDPSSPYVTIRRQLAVLAPWLPTDWRLPAGAVLVTPVVLAAYRTVETYRDRLVALTATLLATLILFPLESFYLALAIFPLVPVAYLLGPGTARELYLAGFLLISLPVSMVTVHQWAAFLPPVADDVLFAVAESLFGFVLPPMIGVWLVLVSCVLYQHRRVSSSEGVAPPAGR